MPSCQCSERLLARGADDVVAGPPRVVGPHFEAGGINQAVDLVLTFADDDAVARDGVDAAPVGVHQGDVGAVEGLEVLVVEAGPLAELPVPGLEGFGGRRILDDVVHPRPDLLHLLEVGQLHHGWPGPGRPPAIGRASG